MNPTRDPDLIEAEREAIRQTERLFGLSQAQRATRREKSGEVSPLKYGQETELLSQTIPIVEALYLWVNGTSFQIDTSRQFANENAHALWQGCKFSVLE
jgi:hypothetical protein